MNTKISNEVISNSDIATKTELNEVKTTAENALPKTGGTMTGDLKLQSFDDDITETASFTTARNIISLDKNEKQRGAIVFAHSRFDNDIFAALSARKYIDDALQLSEIAAHFAEDNTTYATAPNPRNNYGTDIVTTKYLKDYAPQKHGLDIHLYIDAVTGSDTNDLFAGRGMSLDKPFASLLAAVNWVKTNICGAGTIYINLLSDIVLTGNLTIDAPQVKSILIQGHLTSKKITIPSGNRIYVSGGGAAFQRVEIIGNNALQLLCCDAQRHASHAFFGGEVTFNGSVTNSTLSSVIGGQILVAESINGSVTGTRYRCMHGASIITRGLGENAIPGSAAGVCDSSSAYI